MKGGGYLCLFLLFRRVKEHAPAAEFFTIHPVLARLKAVIL